jgi:hypothetical protein
MLRTKERESKEKDREREREKRENYFTNLKVRVQQAKSWGK